MSSDSSTIVDPFDISALDEETELRALARAIQFSDKFALLFARCNQPQQRKRLVERLRTQLPQLDAQEIHFTEPVTHLLNALRERIRDPQPDVIFVSGLEYSLPTADDAHNTSFVANLNAARNSFPNIVQSPLVLWVPEYALTAIARGAPDFFSIRSGVYFFAASATETADKARSLTTGDAWSAWNLSLDEKQERIAAIESLLADYEALPSNQRDYEIEIQLHWRLGSLFSTQAAYPSAQQHFETLLRLAIELSSPKWKSIALNGLGNIYYDQRRVEEAAALYQQSLEISQELGEQENVAQALGNLGNIYSTQGQQEKAEESYKRSLDIFQQRGDRQSEALALTALGHLYHNQGELEEAERAFQKSLVLAREIGSKVVESYGLTGLGSTFRQQGRLEEASSMYQQSLEISRRLGSCSSEGRTLYNLALLRNAEGRKPEALELLRQFVTDFEKTVDQKSLEQAREFVRELEQQLQEQSNPVGAKE